MAVPPDQVLLGASAAISLGAAALAVCTGFKNRSLERRVKQMAESQSALSESLGQVAAGCAETGARCERLEEQNQNRDAWVSGLRSVNLNRRAQVLQLHRKGSSVAEIASALRVAQGEVKLLIKTQEIFREGSGTERKEALAARRIAR